MCIFLLRLLLATYPLDQSESNHTDHHQHTERHQLGAGAQHRTQHVGCHRTDSLHQPEVAERRLFATLENDAVVGWQGN